MQTKVIERISKESLHQLLPDIIPGLLQVQNPMSQMLLSTSHYSVMSVTKERMMDPLGPDFGKVLIPLGF